MTTYTLQGGRYVRDGAAAPAPEPEDWRRDAFGTTISGNHPLEVAVCSSCPKLEYHASCCPGQRLTCAAGPVPRSMGQLLGFIKTASCPLGRHQEARHGREGR